VTIRAAGPSGKDRKVDLKIQTQSGSTVDEKALVVPGKGYQTFNDVNWSGIKLNPSKKELRLYVFFVSGNTNLCSIKVRIKPGQGSDGDDDGDDDDTDPHPVNRYIPFAVNAVEGYDDAKELDDAVYGQCKVGQPPIDEPDAQTTTDPKCKELGPCHISHTYDGETVTYNFKANGNGQKMYADITARVSSAPGSHRSFAMEIVHGHKVDAIEYFQTPGEGYHNFADVTWRKVPIDTSYDVHKLVIRFVNGNINLCSIQVEWHDHHQPTPPVSKPTPHPVATPTPKPVYKPTSGGGDTPPITFAAFDFDHAYDNSSGSQGNCYHSHRDGVDGKVTTDDTCMDRDHSQCQIGWTEAKGK
jgi:hypothetical protein